MNKFLTTIYHLPTTSYQLLKKLRLRTKIALGIIAILLPIVIAAAIWPEGGKAGWWNESWSYRKLITIQSSQVSGSTDLTDFPVLIQETDTDLSDSAQADGGDIVFTDYEGNKLDHEIESFDSATGALTAWVRIPTLKANENTQIFMYYGNHGVENQERPSNVWGENYQGVWHLSGGASTASDFYTDSTKYANHGTLTDAEAVSVTKLNGALDLEGNVNDRIDISDDDIFDAKNNQGYTWSFWLNSDDLTTDVGHNIWFQGIDTSNYINIQAYSTTSTFAGPVTNGISIAWKSSGFTYTTRHSTDNAIAVGTWYYVTVTYNPSAALADRFNIYVNGSNVTDTTDDETGSGGNQEGNFSTTDTNISFVPTYGDAYDGKIDEFRYSTNLKSTDWIITEYNSTNSPSGTFYTYGSEEVGPGPTAFWKFDEGVDNTCPDGSDACDSTQGNHLAASGGPSWQTEDLCVSGKCLYYDGSDDYLSTADNPSLSLTESLTLSGWVKPVANSADTHYGIISKANGNQNDYQLVQYGDEIRMYIGSDSNYETTDAADLQIGRWYHVAGVYDSASQTVKIYLNGQLQSSTTTGTIPSSITDNSTDFNIGLSYLTGGSDSQSLDVSTNLDDWEIDGTTFYQDGEGSNILWNGAWAGHTNWGALRVALSKDIPSGASIDSATINLYSQGTYQWDSSSDFLRIYVTDSANAGRATTAAERPDVDADYGGSTNVYPSTLSSGIRWPASGGLSWPASGSTATSVDISELIQYLVDSYGGLTAGSYITVWFGHDDSVGDGNSEIGWLDRNAGATNAAGLDISWSQFTTHPFQGFIDEVKIYPYARSAEEIKSDYAKGANILAEKTNFLSDGLLGYWKLDESSGNAADSSGNGLTLTNNGAATFVGGKFGNGSEHTPASTQYFSTATTINNIKTVSFWVNPDSNTNYYINLTASAYITSSSGTLSATGFNNPTVYVNGQESSTITADTWQLITITDETGINADQFTVGRQGANYFDGTLDEVRLYNRRLSAEEVQELYSWAPGPVVYYKFDENTGTSTVYDRSGNSYNGTLNGSMTESDWVSGYYGSALEFDGTDDYISVSTGPSGVNTVSFWVYPETNSEVFVDMATDGTDISASSGIILASGFTNPTIYVNGIESTTLTAGQWQYITVVTDTAENAAFFNIGQLGTSYFEGKIDEFKFYNYVRTPAQILQDMTAQSGSTLGSETAGGIPSPLAHWSFDEQSGQTVNDSAGNNSGTLGTSSASGSDDPTWIMSSCKLNGCLSFDGGDHVAVSDTSAISPTSEISLSAWVNPRTSVASKALIVKDGAYRLVTDGSGYPLCQIHNGTSWQTAATSSVALTFNVWQQVGCSYSQSQGEIKVYVDGKKTGSQSLGTAIADTTNALEIGRDASATYSNYIGYMDEVRLYSFALTTQQLKIDHNVAAAINFGSGHNEADSLTDGAGDQPFGYWPLDENTGTTTTFDKAGSNNGTLNSFSESSWVQGKLGSALSFNSSSGNYIDLGNSSALEPPKITVQAWIRTNTTGVEMAVLTKDNATFDGERSYQFKINTTNQVQFIVFDQSYAGSADQGVNYDAISSTSTVTDGQWHLITGTWDGSTIRVYVDGNLESSKAFSGLLNTSSVNAFIGKLGHASTFNYFNGEIDEVKIYDYARTPAQIAYDYNRGKPIGHWRFDECYGTTAHDSSPFANHGTITPGAGTHTSVGTCGSGSASEMWDDGESGQANQSLDFDGSDDYVNVGDQGEYDFNDLDFSIAGWFKRESYTTDDTIIAKYDEVGNQGFLLWIDDANDNLVFAISDGDGTNSFQASSNSSFTTNQWVHFVVSYDDSNSTGTKIYINGQDSGTSYSTVGTFSLINDLSNTADLRIGSRSDGTDPFAGQLDDLQIYNYALSAEQVKKLYNQNSAIRFE